MLHPPGSGACQNGGVCVTHILGDACQCAPGFFGNLCAGELHFIIVTIFLKYQYPKADLTYLYYKGWDMQFINSLL